jgi:hypothetical protein
MEQDSTKPTLAQFKGASRHEFSFLGELGYSERPDSDPADRFNVRFSNGELTLSIRGENWGEHAGVRLFHADGREAPLRMRLSTDMETPGPSCSVRGYLSDR